MGDFKRMVIFIFMVFAILLGLSLLAKSQEGILVPYEPYQTIRPTTYIDVVEVYDSIIDFKISERVNKPYALITSSEEGGWNTNPIYSFVDYGTYREIDSLKCIRYKQMQWKMYYLDKLNEKDCD